MAIVYQYSEIRLTNTIHLYSGLPYNPTFTIDGVRVTEAEALDALWHIEHYSCPYDTVKQEQIPIPVEPPKD